MKTPEEIKKGLENCTRLGGCVSCPYFVDHTIAQCTPVMAAEALAYIHQLEAELEQVKRTTSNDNVNGNVRAILDEICAFKREAKEFASSDYSTGYLSALSALEGFIAGLPVVPPAPTWISVKERLPEKKKRVMVYTTQGAYRLGAFSFVGKEGAVWFKCDKSCISCSHWMPLPEPPEEEA